MSNLSRSILDSRSWVVNKYVLPTGGIASANPGRDLSPARLQGRVGAVFNPHSWPISVREKGRELGPYANKIRRR
jgi:hypothetical protein